MFGPPRRKHRRSRWRRRPIEGSRVWRAIRKIKRCHDEMIIVYFRMAGGVQKQFTESGTAGGSCYLSGTDAF